MAAARCGDVPAAVVGLLISSIAVLLRCYTRLAVVRQFGWDDGLMLIAMVCHQINRTDWSSWSSCLSWHLLTRSLQALGVFYGAVGIVSGLSSIGKKDSDFKSEQEFKEALFVTLLPPLRTPSLANGCHHPSPI